MLCARNDMRYVYDRADAEKMVNQILKEYIPEFQKLQNYERH